MELYTKVAYANSRQLTLSYSTSFGLSSRLFGKDIQKHIYAIYGLVRIADEIVDTYKGTDSSRLLDNLENDTYEAMKSRYSTNPIIHAFALTARQYDITQELIKPFFDSMRMDLHPQNYTDKNYEKYIYGSAEVVGLMCLKVFCDDNDQYDKLKIGASALGSAYQKVNFLRDLSEDYRILGRLYFPAVTFEDFNDKAKHRIVKDIKKDFATALPALQALPESSRKATMMSYVYYSKLLEKLEQTPAEIIKTTRIRLPSHRKLLLLAQTVASRGRTS